MRKRERERDREGEREGKGEREREREKGRERERDGASTRYSFFAGAHQEAEDGLHMFILSRTQHCGSC